MSIVTIDNKENTKRHDRIREMMKDMTTAEIIEMAVGNIKSLRAALLINTDKAGDVNAQLKVLRAEEHALWTMQENTDEIVYRAMFEYPERAKKLYQ